MVNIDDRIEAIIIEKCKAKGNCIWVLKVMGKFLDKKNQCYPSHATIIKDTGLSLDIIKRTLLELKKAGLISWKKRVNNKGGTTSNLYTVTKLISKYNTTPLVHEYTTPQCTSAPPPSAPVHYEVLKEEVLINNTICALEESKPTNSEEHPLFEAVKTVALEIEKTVPEHKHRIPKNLKAFEGYGLTKNLKARLSDYKLEEILEVIRFDAATNKSKEWHVYETLLRKSNFERQHKRMKIAKATKTKSIEGVSIADFYKKYLAPSVIKMKRDELNQYAKQYEELKTECQQIKEVFQIRNETLTAPLIFDIRHGMLKRAGTTPERRLRAFETFLNKISDYDRNKADLRKLFSKHLSY